MTMFGDIGKILRDWPYDPDDDCRLLQTAPGKQVLQVRTPMGIEQYELDGRPDGCRPHDRESAFQYYQEKLESAKAAGKEAEFDLRPEDCEELFNEGTLIYFRYVHLFQMKDWVRTMRDTKRNLAVFDFVHRYARREDDQFFLEKWRPYLIRIHAQAAAMLALEQREFSSALKSVREGIETINALPAMEDETFSFERERSLKSLKDLLADVERSQPVTQLARLEQQLKKAIEKQEFEKAAQLRDRIRSLKDQPN